MKYIFINPVVDQMYIKEELDKALIENGYQRVEVQTDWHKIVKEKYTKALKETNLTILDRRCPKAIEAIHEYFNKEEMLEPSIEPILIHCAIELANREDLKDKKKIITTPCESLAYYGNKLNLQNTEFISWKVFAKQTRLDEMLEVKQLEASPIPPGYFTELGVKTTSLSGEENIKAYFKSDLHRQDELVEMLYCHHGCNNGDGVLMNERK
ncbi:MAG: hypothetical protein IIY08_08045 [Cellulosilyticum sp.]|nr:hypothetical protein [Cellulosilyticum sp.]